VCLSSIASTRLNLAKLNQQYDVDEYKEKYAAKNNYPEWCSLEVADYETARDTNVHQNHLLSWIHSKKYSVLPVSVCQSGFLVASDVIRDSRHHHTHCPVPHHPRKMRRIKLRHYPGLSVRGGGGVFAELGEGVEGASPADSSLLERDEHGA
jgi:hypothetical protein